MYSRLLKISPNKSFFLFGPRGTGKTTWVKKTFPNSIYLDLLDSDVFNDLQISPKRLDNIIPKDYEGFIILDEIQLLPELLNEVHRQIETYGRKFILTGSSARKLRRGGFNLLAGRALTYSMHPLTSQELGDDFNLNKSLSFGQLPSIFTETNPEKYLKSYVKTYLDEEIKQEGLTRNVSAFARFLEIASFSQGSLINTSEIARESAVERKSVENYFNILEDLLIGYRIPVFSKRAKRRLVRHVKFYFFDVGIYKILKLNGPYDTPEEASGIALESLFFQELMALNDYLELNYKIYYYRTAHGQEVDFVAYGENGFHAFEIKHTRNITNRHLRGLKTFAKDYPEAKLHVFYLGNQMLYIDNITVYPFKEGLKNLHKLLTESQKNKQANI